MTLGEPRIVAVRRGRVQPSSSWIYVWVDAATGDIAYVGATPYDPALRTHLHLESDDAQLGRVRATVDGYAERDFDVLAFELAADIERAEAKDLLKRRLRGDASPSPTDASTALWRAVDDIARAVEHRCSEIDGRGRAGG
ncbi:hypothetical protein ACI2K6_00350 [Microbacterium sp. NPDC006705]|uniref:hypothetical protein n=1 Tax=Microbacterium TaxID=33882 RepID=UPI00249E5A3F|nr:MULTISPECIES: hypothetical protein [Microbacterium]WHE34917.1 hypothetical protein P6897_09385 [Microbacterium sp. BDGP8]WRK16021.1 hypothetical protein VC184_08790 [Microbacterium plantarum]